MFLKRLDPIVARWPLCLRALASTVLVKEAGKMTFGQVINVKVTHTLTHSVTTLINSRGYKWLADSRMAHYQGLLYGNPWVWLETPHTLNPANFLPTEPGPPDYYCEEAIGEVFSGCPDLTDKPLSNLKINSLWMGEVLSQMECGRQGMQLLTSLLLRPNCYLKVGQPSEPNYEHQFVL